MIVAIGADHNGVSLKAAIVEFLRSRGVEVLDMGTQSADSVDYPDFAFRVARAVAEGRADRGILICGTGIGMAIAANKVPGIRAANCNDLLMARLARKDNDANVLTLGGRILAPYLAREIVAVFLDTPFEGGRHARRLQKIANLEEQLSAGATQRTSG